MILLQSKPHRALQPHIEQYMCHSMNTSILPSLQQTFLPYDRPAISFFIGPVLLVHDKEHLTGQIKTPETASAFAYLNALTTTSNTFYFKGNEDVKVIIVQFKPAGFWALFRRDMEELTNLLPNFSLLTNASESGLFTEQLLEAKEFNEQVTVLNNFFLKKLMLCTSKNEQIREASRKLILTDGLISMKDLAYATNMSLKTLERRFTEQIGVSPKVFARIKRFHHALKLMNQMNKISIKEIVYDCGYYDLAHINKEFRLFNQQPPSAYFSKDYFLYNQMIIAQNFSTG
jgi:AraC-like DNA-binding protein